MPEIDEKDVLALLKADDPRTVKRLFYQFYPFLCNTIFRILKDKALAEDLAQDTFFKFWEKRQTIDIQTSLKAYLRRMAVNEALYHIRKNKKFQKDSEAEVNDLGGATDSVEEQLLHQELEAKIAAAIQTLPPRCQQVFRLSRFEDLSYKEIAAKLDISIKTVENQMGKALKILRSAMKDYLHFFLF
ncbi:MAG: RNA polymerase sigma-70 factor [Bacteroidota bacterium]